MSLRFRLIGLVCLALAVSLALDCVTAWVNALLSVWTETRRPIRTHRSRVSALMPISTAVNLSSSIDRTRCPSWQTVA